MSTLPWLMWLNVVLLLVVNPVSCWIASSTSGYTISTNVTVKGGVSVINSTGGQPMDVGAALLSLQQSNAQLFQLVQQQSNVLQALQQQVVALSSRTAPLGNRVRVVFQGTFTSCAIWEQLSACNGSASPVAISFPGGGRSVDGNIVCDATTVCVLQGPGSFDITVWMQGEAGSASMVWSFNVYAVSGWLPAGLTAPAFLGVGGAVLAYESNNIGFNPTTFPAMANLTIPAGQSTTIKVVLGCISCGGGVSAGRVLEIQQRA